MEQQLQDLKQAAESGQAAAQYRYGAILLQQGAIESAFSWLHKAAEQGVHRATELIGTLILTGHGVKPDAALAFEYFRRAGQAGDAQALFRCAELMFSGKGINQDRAGAIDCLIESAKQGYPLALRNIAFLMLAESTEQAANCARTCLALAALSGDPLSQHSYALLLRDLDENEAGYWFAEAAQRGLSRAQVNLQKYPQCEGVTHPDAAQRSQWLQQVQSYLDTYQFMATPDQQQSVALSQNPDVKIATRLLSEIECDYLIHIAQPHLQPAKVVTVGQQEQVDSYRTGETANLAKVLDFISDWLNERICRVAGVPVNHAEPTAIIHYKPGQQYHEHGDYLPEQSPLMSIAAGGQRIKTALVYLNDDYIGGATFFSTPNLKVLPKTGNAIVFINADEQGQPLVESKHAGQVVESGEKWLLSIWLRQHPINR